MLERSFILKMKLKLFEMISVDAIMGERSNTQPDRKKQKSAIRGKVEGWGVQRGNRMEGGEVPTFTAVLLLLPLPRGFLFA